MYGELVPVGGGDPIPLLKKTLLVGRRESCDIVLRFSNVSAHHCQLTVNAGYWYIRDMQSRNGIKVNGVRVSEKRVDPGDIVSVAKHKYELHYSPMDLGAVGPPPPDHSNTDIFSKSLLERAGLERKNFLPTKTAPDPNEQERYNLDINQPNQIRFRNRPV
jgi:predicted component of type VI protein secretion system